MIFIRFTKLDEKAVVPRYGDSGAACFDLTVTRIDHFGDNKAVLHFGLAVEIPEGYKLLLVPRSSFTHKGWLMANAPGQIDASYRGELQMRLEAIPTVIEELLCHGDGDETYFRMIYPPLPFKVGDRAAQAYPEKVIQAQFQEVDTLSETARGLGGFGSTGR